MRVLDDFTPALGLGSGHAQTIYASKLSPAPVVATRRETVELPDGDFVDIDWLDGSQGAPSVLLLHGLEGSSGSRYLKRSLALLAQRGWHGAALNMRSCSGRPNRLAKSYSSGFYDDALYVLQRLPQPRLAMGFSLGGSVLLNLLAQRGADTGLVAAAAVSVPFDLAGCARLLDAHRGLSHAYLRYFLPSMKAKALAKAAAFPHVLDAERIAAASGIRDFDHVVTAPLFGFTSAEDYYERCSTAGQVAHIRVPTLLVTAEDDPLAPASMLPCDAEHSAALWVLRTRFGGHCGFITGSLARPRAWAEARALAWLAQQL